MKAISFVILLFPFSVAAQVPPDRTALLNADEAGQAQLADLAGFPDPKLILDHAKDLQLTETQRKSVQSIYSETRTRAIELGKHIIEIEAELNQAFREGLVNEKAVRDDTEQIGKLRGRLRAVHLNARLRAKEVLSAAQADIYKKLRAKSDEPGAKNKKP